MRGLPVVGVLTASMLSVVSSGAAEQQADRRPLVDRVFGPVTEVDQGQRRFQYVNTAGQVKVTWTDKTRFSFSEARGDLSNLKPEGQDARLSLGRNWKRELQSGQFTTERGQVFSSQGQRPTAMPTQKAPVVAGVLKKAGKGFEIHVGDKTFKVRPLRRRAQFVFVSPAAASDLVALKTRARVDGKESDGTVVANSVLLERHDAAAGDVPGLPRVLIIGDSISMQFHPYLVQALEGKVNVHRVAANCGPSARGVQNIRHWLGPYWVKELRWDAIQFNHGLHDLRQRYDAAKKAWTGEFQESIDQYKKNLAIIVPELKKTGAKLIWATTTPVPPGSGGREAGTAKRYNAAAMEVIGKHPDILVNDLFQACQGHYPGKEWGGMDGNVHHAPPGREALGRIVAKFLLKTLGLEQELNPPAKK